MSLDPRDLTEIRKIVVASQLLSSGAFKAELERIDAATAKLAAQQTIAKTLEEAEHIRGEAQNVFKNKEAEIARAESNLNKREVIIKTREEKLQADKQAYESDSGSRAQTLSKAENDLANRTAALEPLERNLQERIAGLVRRENSVESRELSVRDREREVEEKRQQLLAIAS